MALVIGNAAYVRLPALSNTISDARLIAGKLRAAGFEVESAENLTKDMLGRAVRDFGRLAPAAEAAVTGVGARRN